MRARTTAEVRGRAVAYQVVAWFSAFVMSDVLCVWSYGTMLLVAEDGLGGRRISRGSRVLRDSACGGRRKQLQFKGARAGAYSGQWNSRGVRMLGRCM